MNKLWIKKLGGESARILITMFLCLNSLSSFAQSMVTGLVSDASNNPLPGVTISIKGSQKTSAVTNIDGRYTISVPSQSTLVFSCIGMKSQEIKIKSQKVINITRWRN